MQYREILDSVKNAAKIPDDSTADAAVKKVLGILASGLHEEQARKMAEALPEPLTYEKLRGYQTRPSRVEFDQFMEEVKGELRVSGEQAGDLVDCVFHAAKDTMGDETFNTILRDLPESWRSHLVEV